MLMNNLLRKRSINVNNLPNIFKDCSENNLYRWRQRRWLTTESKHIVDIIKFNCCQLICYYPTRHCSNDIKINLAKKTQEFFRKTMDVINVFQNIISSNKIFKLIAKNQRTFNIYDKELFNYYNKQVISYNRNKNTKKNIELNN